MEDFGADLELLTGKGTLKQSLEKEDSLSTPACLFVQGKGQEREKTVRNKLPSMRGNQTVEEFLSPAGSGAKFTRSVLREGVEYIHPSSSVLRIQEQLLETCMKGSICSF